jgi:antitoxin component YwqK of YwqJK toxin-antitoxin module
MFVGEKISYNQNGVIERIEKLFHPTSLDDSLYDCHITNYRPDGTKINKYEYLNNKLNGLTIDYDSTGKVARTAEYHNGKMNGKETLFYSNGKIKSVAFVKHDTLRGFDIELKENGDTLKWFNSGEYGVNGLFYKKWLSDGRILTGNYGDSSRSYAIWIWYDKTNKKITSKIDKSADGQYIAPE